MIRNPSGVQAVERALAILRLFTPQCPELDLAEVSRRLRLPKSTCHRLIRTLGHSGFIIEGDGYGRYRLGLAAAQLGDAATALLRPSETVRGYMRELNARFEETIGLTRLHGGKVLVLDRVESPLPFRMDYGIGALLPVHSTASGKVLLALSEHRDELLRSLRLEAFTPHTITDRARLRTELQRVRRDGYAVDRQESYLGLVCLAVPVRDQVNGVVAALGISGPAARLEPKRFPQLAAALARSANRIAPHLAGTAANGAARRGTKIVKVV
ncbi:MAG TPA: IclR family transcriptional regulator [Gaiellales bacterium]|nr:IclR family transcriptional regulator [Gaiellales bacterium]